MTTNQAIADKPATGRTLPQPIAARAAELQNSTAMPVVKGYLEDHHLDHLEEWLDTKFRVPGIGINFGLDGIIGLVPVVGDIATTGLSSVFVADAIKMGARKRTVARMVGNIALDFAVGSVPLVGDLFDFAFKSNLKNLRLLRAEKAHLSTRLAQGSGDTLTS